MSNPAILPATATVLSDAVKRIHSLEDSRLSHEKTYQLAVLPLLLKQGLHCLKAHCAFAVKDPAKRGQGRKPKITSTVDVISPQGFESWLSANIPFLSKGSAYRYMTAVRGLGLDDTAAESAIDRALESCGLTSIKALCDAAIEAVGPPAPPPPPKIEQQEFEFLKQACTSLREEVESLVAIKAQLDANPDFKRVATARLYSALHDLTGTHWKPSDEPDDLALVDPDAISL